MLDTIAVYLSQMKKKGAIRNVEPRVAAIHLKGLLDAGVVEPMLFGGRPELKPSEAVGTAVRGFLAAYGKA